MNERAQQILVLATTSPVRVQRAVVDVQRRFPGGEVTIATTRVNDQLFRQFAVATWVLGERFLDLDAPAVRAEIEQRSFDLIVIPIGFPATPLLYVKRLVSRLNRQLFEVWVGRRARSRNRRVVLLLLSLVSYGLYPPVGLLIRCCRFLDGGGVIAALILARMRARVIGREERSGPVCHVISAFSLGGAQRQFIDYVEHTAVSHDDLFLIALDACSHADNLQAIEDSGCRYAVLGDAAQASWWGRMGIVLAPRTTWLVQLVVVFCRLRPRCTYSWLFLTNVVAAPAARLTGVPLVVSSIRNLSAWKTWPEYRMWWFRSADRLAAPLNDALVGNSRAVAEDYAAWSGIDRAVIGVIPNGIDEQRFLGAPFSDVKHILHLPPGVPVVLAMGRLAVEKDFSLLIDCAGDLRDLGFSFRLLIVGDGELDGELRTRIDQLDLGEMVIMVGRSAEPQSFYRAADIFVLSSRIEGMPNAVIEAQLFGLPVVTTASGGAAEIVIDGETGLVVEVGDRPALVAALQRLLSNPDQAGAMGARGAERMRSEFGIERTAEAIDRLTRCLPDPDPEHK